MTSEGRIQKKAIDYAKGLGFLAKRNYTRQGGETGWPDVEFFGPYGIMLMIEFKAPHKEPSAIQKHRISELRERGYTVHVCSSFEHAKAIFDAIAL